MPRPTHIGLGQLAPFFRRELSGLAVEIHAKVFGAQQADLVRIVPVPADAVGIARLAPCPAVRKAQHIGRAVAAFARHRHAVLDPFADRVDRGVKGLRNLGLVHIRVADPGWQRKEPQLLGKIIADLNVEQLRHGLGIRHVEPQQQPHLAGLKIPKTIASIGARMTPDP